MPAGSANGSYGLVQSGYSRGFWQDGLTTTFILLGPMLQDSANAPDMLIKLAMRIALFIGVALYAWLMVYLLEEWRARSACTYSHQGECFMLKTLAIGLPVMLLCLTIQASLTGLSVQHFLRRITPGAPQLKILGNIRLLMAALIILMLGNLLQIAIWGALFVWLGEFTELSEAVYHSAVNYASLGYGDIVMSKNWKLLGPLEAVKWAC